MPWGKTTPWTRWPRVFRESELGSRTIVHEVSLTTGEEQTVGKTLIGIMWPRWQTGHSRREPSTWTQSGETHWSAMETPVLANNNVFLSGDMMQFKESFCETRSTWHCNYIAYCVGVV